MTLRTRITMPETAKRGEVIEIRLIALHPMERGGRDALTGRTLPRRLLHRFTAQYGGEEVFAMDLHTGVAANPYIAFTTVATESGEITFTWFEDGGAVFRRAQLLKVT